MWGGFSKKITSYRMDEKVFFQKKFTSRTPVFVKNIVGSIIPEKKIPATWDFPANENSTRFFFWDKFGRFKQIGESCHLLMVVFPGMDDLLDDL